MTCTTPAPLGGAAQQMNRGTDGVEPLWLGAMPSSEPYSTRLCLAGATFRPQTALLPFLNIFLKYTP
jgi:hypothetical protein